MEWMLLLLSHLANNSKGNLPSSFQPNSDNPWLLSPIFSFVSSQFVHFLAKVVQGNAVEVQSMQAAGNNLDVNQYNEAVNLMHSPKYSHLFVE